ncbi:hypothetical protein [Moorena sp. SIO4G3]|nr:hypothetical protein [Moorena sp. SIO4G3]
MQKYFSDRVWVNSSPLFPVPCSLFPTSARSLITNPLDYYPLSTHH